MTSQPNQHLLAIEIGGTKLQLALGDASGNLLLQDRRTVEPERGAEGIRAQILEALGCLISRARISRNDLVAVGIGFGGPVEPERGIVVESHQIQGWTGFPLAEWVREQTGVAAVSIQNDADTAGLGEAISGAGAGFSPVLYVTIGSGIGGGLIIDGSIYRGAGGGAVEIGHLWVHPRNESPSKLEHVASGWGIGRCARRWLADTEVPSQLRQRPDGGTNVSGAEVSAAAELGDRLALDVLERARAAMVEALAHAVTLLAPRRIILGGGVSLMPDRLWISPIREAIDEWVFPQFRSTFDIVPAALGESVVLHGALALAAVAQKRTQ